MGVKPQSGMPCSCFGPAGMNMHAIPGRFHLVHDIVLYNGEVHTQHAPLHRPWKEPRTSLNAPGPFGRVFSYFIVSSPKGGTPERAPGVRAPTTLRSSPCCPTPCCGTPPTSPPARDSPGTRAARAGGSSRWSSPRRARPRARTHRPF